VPTSPTEVFERLLSAFGSAPGEVTQDRLRLGAVLHNRSAVAYLTIWSYCSVKSIPSGSGGAAPNVASFKVTVGLLV
jgi:hypothetical protein